MDMFYIMEYNENRSRKKLRSAKSLIRYLNRPVFPEFSILFVIYISEIIPLLILTDFSNPYL